VYGAARSGPLALTLIAFGVLVLGGWLGGTIVFVHGMRVLNLVGEPSRSAVVRAPSPEQQAAAGERSTSTSESRRVASRC
jgi:hypothetical protein